MSTEEATTVRSEADEIVDGMEFGELCNEFECISSPLVESTARQLARDILELREGNRALGTFAVSVKYKVCVSTIFPDLFFLLKGENWTCFVLDKFNLQDPVRSFTGRGKYKRPLWITTALDKPSVVRNLSMCFVDSFFSLFLFVC